MFFLLILVGGARAQTTLLPSDPHSFGFTGTGLATWNVVNVTPPAGASFTQAWDVNVTANTAGHNVTVGVTTTSPVAQGDVLVATVWYRRMDSATEEANLAFVCDGPGANSRAASFGMRGRGAWRQVNIPFLAAAAGTQHFFIEIGFTPQEVQLGGMQLVDYGQRSVLTNAANTLDCVGQFTPVLLRPQDTAGSTSPGAVAVSGNAFFSTATQVTTTSCVYNASGPEYVLSAVLPKAVKRGDTLVATLWLARDAGSDRTHLAVSGYSVATTASPGVALSSFGPLAVDQNWKQFCIPFTADADHAANTLQFQIWCGGAVQKLDVAGVQLVDLGTAVAAASLTNNATDYVGRSLNDPWRAAAQARIQQNRMGNLTVNVQNASGAAVPGATVAAAMQKHRFGFATLMDWQYMLGNPGGGVAADPTYQNFLSVYTAAPLLGHPAFNKYNDSGYKWDRWEQSGDPDLHDRIQKWMRGHGITSVHGHNLVWPNYEATNKSAPASPSNPYYVIPQDVPPRTGSDLTSRVLTHLDSEVSDPTVRSFVDDWDVVNEPWTSFDIQGVLAHLYNPPPWATGTSPGPWPNPQQNADGAVGWFQETALKDPAARLFINEDGIESNSAHTNPREENYDYDLLTELVRQGTPINGIGFESHFRVTATAPQILQTIFDRFATIQGKSLVEQVTEYDTEFTDPYLQADYLADYLTMVFSEPNFDQFCLWGFWGKDAASRAPYNGRPSGILVDDQWNVVPSGEAYWALVLNKWWTNTTATANASGVATVNGFLGRYALTASYGGITKTYYADLPTTAGATVNLKLVGSSGSYHVWLYEAEKAEGIYAPLAVAVDPNASGGACLSSPAGTNYSSPPSAAQARINMPDASGNVTIWVRVIANDPQSDSFFAQIDNNAWQVLSLPNGTSWHWYKWTTTTLAAGTAHVLNLGCRETTARLDQVLVTDDPNFTP